MMNDRTIFAEASQIHVSSKSGSICPSWWTWKNMQNSSKFSLRLLQKLFALSEFLLDEKGAKMRELPCTGDT